jgi:hypothetical protein
MSVLKKSLESRGGTQRRPARRAHAKRRRA